MQSGRLLRSLGAPDATSLLQALRGAIVGYCLSTTRYLGLPCLTLSRASFTSVSGKISTMGSMLLRSANSSI